MLECNIWEPKTWACCHVPFVPNTRNNQRPQAGPLPSQGNKQLESVSAKEHWAMSFQRLCLTKLCSCILENKYKMYLPLLNIFKGAGHWGPRELKLKILYEGEEAGGMMK